MSTVDVVDKSWHHIVGVFSKDLTDLEASYNTIIFIDGEEYGHGLIPTPYTHVGGPDNSGSAHGSSYCLVSAFLYNPSGGGFYDGVVSNDNRVDGMIDDIRVYDRTLSPLAVDWLLANSGE